MNIIFLNIEIESFCAQDWVTKTLSRAFISSSLEMQARTWAPYSFVITVGSRNTVNYHTFEEFIFHSLYLLSVEILILFFVIMEGKFCFTLHNSHMGSNSFALCPYFLLRLYLSWYIAFHISDKQSQKMKSNQVQYPWHLQEAMSTNWITEDSI